jgi:hypothetical protein
VSWDVEYIDEFETWWNELTADEQNKIDAAIRVLSEDGPNLSFPASSGIKTSRHAQMRELRIQIGGRPFRVLYAFDPRRAAILLLGGDKTGDDRWYEKNVPVADDRYDEHLLQLEREKKKGR